MDMGHTFIVSTSSCSLAALRRIAYGILDYYVRCNNP